MSRIITLGKSNKIFIPDRKAFRDHIRDRLELIHWSERDKMARLLAPKYKQYASGWVDGEEQDILELWFQGAALTNDPDFVSLFITTPTDAGASGVEATYTGYLREVFANTSTEWGSSVAGAPSTIQNLVVLTFNEATAGGPDTVLSWGYHTLVSAGVLLFFGVLDTSKVISVGDTPQFNAGDMVAKLGDPGDSF